MGHHQQRLVAAVQIALQPFYHLEVEMVRRLVEYQEVRLRQQHVGQCHALLLSSGELPHRLLQVAYLQLCEHLLGLQHLLWVTLMVKASIKHTLLGVELRRLLQHPHLQVATEDDAAAVVALLAREHGEQRRLTRAVLGNQPHLLPFGNREADILKQHQRAKRLRQLLHIEIWSVLCHSGAINFC